MGFGFTQQSGIGKQVRAIAGEQISKALAECWALDSDFDKTVHGLRRRCKKLRGLVRLIEPQFKTFAAENRAFRDAADGLAVARDATVMLETFGALVEFDAGRGQKARLDRALAGQIHQVLRDRIDGGLEERNRKQLLAAFAGTMLAAEQRAHDWVIAGRGFARIGDGLEATYRRMRAGMRTAAADLTAETLHDWRKDTKYHWHHLGLFEFCAPDLLSGRKALLDDLGELLGDHHNLAVLDETLAAAPGLARSAVLATQAVIVDRQADLAGQAFALGGQLTVEKPGMLRRRFEQYWSLLPVET
ncbi:CHAD domain containing protein [Devosia sp. LC5]|uniref:CHAD domain-containing protein n=1 Tax=Devosia sp. LC5 TaxID=1502724 RepID=UPI0004E2C673|nr:CHAD domain-containing protein [Devosia sp. LC5]KFC66091.1 CHAD domain containing protein [Devosia sp. LC5]